MFKLLEFCVFLIWLAALIHIVKLYSFPFFISLGFCLGIGLWDLLPNFQGALLLVLAIVLTTFFLVLLQQLKTGWLRTLAFSFFLCLSLYIATGTGFLQGRMSIGIVASIFQTNSNEAFEFFSVIQPKFLIYSFVLFAATVFYFYLYKPAYTVKFKKPFVLFLIVFNLLNLFLIQTVKAVVKYKNEENILYEANDFTPDWGIKEVKYSYDNQVFIIGESVQRDHLSLYGSEHNTTPFLDKMPVTMVADYNSTSANTAMSLPRTLSYMDDEKNIHISMNVMTLAKQAKYNTLWISNQGFVGKNDTAISKTAIHADHRFFLKNGNYMSQSFDDEKMIAILTAQLERYKDKKNIIFVHMMGSHPDACERLFDSPKLYPKQPEPIDCYLSSINKLDRFVQHIYQELNKTKRSFNITYFSDHGMSVTPDGIYVENEYKANYQVPFFVLSSDARQKNYLDKSISAYDFMNIYAGMIGVKTPYLDSQKTLDQIKSNDDITVFDWQNYVKLKSLN
ncbi:glucan phosphoethanolaminetransferase (alkaline phosphatase superfamily) [Acinetobacter calcoaceticus]|uniref:Glucan phosphoethanolaminetransferase (Alkaline phosphatase superfamily) n=1 Tax=Acinetobacter calcoaceticus TaxID=471 RepID=A0A4R1XY77_ACICA|nr:glucan phosphoethanolaminetransferase (alkaline phosphatase superfamily) [Acinetobacter calcoaceticus]